MATYNGERFLSEQIESIRNQTYRNWELLIPDDSSLDTTPEIIKYYEALDNRIKGIYGEINIGAVKNFSYLMKQAKNFSYMMFCDQDDIWKEDKVEKSLQYIMEKETKIKGTPILAYCDKQEIDSKSQEIYAAKRNYSDTLDDILVQNHIYGCTMIINKKLWDMVKDIPAFVENHDYWIAFIAALRGNIVHIPEKLIQYRLHNTNVTGGINNYSLIAKIKNWNYINYIERKTMNQNYRLCQLWQKERNDILEEYINIINERGIRRIWLAMKARYRRDNLLATVRYYYNLMCYDEKEYKN